MKQYMSSKSFVNVDWKKLASSYDSTFGTKTSEGVISHPTAKGAGNWIIDFVTANFQRESSCFSSRDRHKLMMQRGHLSLLVLFLVSDWDDPLRPRVTKGVNIRQSSTEICIIHQADHLSASIV
jgi:hypothetical protein